MEFLTNLLGFGASVGSGGLFGLLGSIVGVAAKYLQKRQELKEHNLDRQHELELIRLQMKSRNQETENELEIVKQEADMIQRSSSYRMPIVTSNVHTWVNDIRALFRPFLTVSLNGAAVFILIYLMSNMEGELAQMLTSDNPVAELVTYMVHSLFFVASTATVWWFGDRALTPPSLKNK